MALEWPEVIEKRNRTSKTRRLHVDGAPTNQYSWDGQVATPVHYKDAGGQWQNISTTLVPSIRSITGFGNPAWEMTNNEYELFVLGELNSGVPVVRYVSKNTPYWVQFAAHNLQWTNDLNQIGAIATPATTTTQVTANEVRWADAYGAGRNLRYIAAAGRMGKWLDIASALPAPPQFIIDGGNPVIEFAEILEFHADLEVWVNGSKWNKTAEVNTATEVQFRSPDGQVQFVFPVALAYHEGVAENASVAGKLHLKKQGPRLYISVRFPWTWLQTATYPIHLDTTVDKQVAASGDDGHRYPTFLITDTYETVGVPTTQVRHAFLRWTGVTLVAPIGVAYIEVYARAVGGAGTLLKVRGVDQDNPDAPTTAGEFDADPLTAAGMDWDGAWTINLWNQSPSLTTIFQELVASYTITNDAIMLQIRDDGGPNYNSNQFYTFDYSDPGLAAKLHIEYTAGAAIVDGAAAGSGVGIASGASLVEVLASAAASGVGISAGTGLLEILAGATASGVAIGSANGLLEVLAQGQASGMGIGAANGLMEVLAAAAASGVGLGTGQGIMEISAGAAGSGVGIGSAASLLEILAQAVGEGIGIGSATSISEVLGNAAGSGVGIGIAQGLAEVLAQASGQGIGLGTAQALVEILATAQGSGIGIGAADALLEVLASALGQAIGIATADGEVIVIAGLVLGSALGSGIGLATADGLVEITATALGSGVGIGQLISPYFLVFALAQASGVGIGKAAGIAGIWFTESIIIASPLYRTVNRDAGVGRTVEFDAAMRWVIEMESDL